MAQLISTDGKYAVKCDDCKEEIRRTDSLSESAAGGYCETCRREIAQFIERHK
jgi:hypothetical protein